MFEIHNISLDTYYECETKNITGNGSGLKLKFKYISAGNDYNNKFIIDKSSIIIINEGENYNVNDIISLIINNNEENIINVKNVRNDSDNKSYDNLLRGFNINYFRGDIRLTYLSKVLIGLGEDKEVVITFLNISYKNCYSMINIQIRMWEEDKNITESTFNSNNYYKGDIEISYNISKKKELYSNSIVRNFEIDYFKDLFIGLTNNISYDSTFKPINFYSLIDKNYSIPKIEAKLILNTTYNSNNNLDITNEKWTTSYLEKNDNIKYYIKIIDLGSDIVGNLPSHFCMAISSEYDYKVIDNTKINYYSDMTSDITSNTKKKFILVNNLLNTNMKIILNNILNNISVTNYCDLSYLKNK